MKNRKNIGLVLGNGFDLDLKYETSYSSYIKSEFCPFSNKDIYSHAGQYAEYELLNYLEKQSNIDKWFDLEKSLSDFVYTIRGGLPHKEYQQLYKTNFKQFQTIKSTLTKYISSEINDRNPESNSVAARLILKYLSYYTDYESGHNQYVIERLPIFSFNYTNLNEIVSRIRYICNTLSHNFNYYQMHGSTANNDIILGCGDGAFEKEPGYFNKEYNFIRKSFDSHYDPPVLPVHLINCDEIIFFGLSFGNIDYQYFDCIFNELCKFERNYRVTNIKKLTFFVKDEKSRLELLHILNERTQKHLNQLFTLNQVKLFVTDGSDSDRIDYYISDNFPSPLVF